METYPEIFRIPIPEFKVRGKRYLSQAEIELLFSGPVVIEEKIDGTLQPGLPIGEYTVFREKVQWKHTIHYTQLPAYLIGFDVYDERNQSFRGQEEKKTFLQKQAIPSVPILYQGEVKTVESLISFLGKPSAFGSPRIEGIVVKNYGKQLFGKIVDPAFEEEINGSPHWRRKPRVLNFLRTDPTNLQQ